MKSNRVERQCDNDSASSATNLATESATHSPRFCLTRRNRAGGRSHFVSAVANSVDTEEIGSGAALPVSGFECDWPRDITAVARTSR